ncbi:hypothetical protein QCN27_03985 [Cereibacter sp. SYSU M97828]|nr:hypothetical protein [Cereibacter flavus]
MTSLKTKTLLPVLAVVGSCGLNVADGCAGWEQIRVADATVDYLAANDPTTLEELIGHHEFGRGRGCWR